jgi:hypothetical protein
MRPHNTRVLSEEKGDTPTQHTSHISGTRVSPLLNIHKKEYLQIILHGILLAPTHNMPIGTHTCKYVCQWACVGPAQESLYGAQAV